MDEYLNREQIYLSCIKYYITQEMLHTAACLANEYTWPMAVQHYLEKYKKGVACAKCTVYLFALFFFFPVLPLYNYLAVIDKIQTKEEMSEEYVEWDVHATNDALTPRVEYDDPLSQFSESEVSFL